MKRNLQILFFTISFFGLNAQAFNFQDDIESYPDGSYVGANSTNWTVWSGAAGEGTAEDATVTTEQAKSGKQSIKLEAGSASSGPMDLVLPFGGEKNLGTMKYSMWVYVTADNSAYFNFQAKATIGTTWALDNYFTGAGKFIATLGSAANGPICEVDFEFEKWNKYELVANLTTNDWEIFLNDVSVVKFSNPNNTIASIDLFPLFGTEYSSTSSLWYVDDVSAEFIPYTLKPRDAGAVTLNYKSKFLADQSAAGSLLIRNLGLAAITSLDLSCKVDNGTPQNVNLTNLNINSLGFATINLPAVIYKAGNSTLSCSINNVNGSPDDDISNNIKNSDLLGIVPAPYKHLVTEEATGTWCQWCPRGAVFLDSMNKTYPDHFVGIAVHNADPMVIPAYDAWLGTFPGFP